MEGARKGKKKKTNREMQEQEARMLHDNHVVEQRRKSRNGKNGRKASLHDMLCSEQKEQEAMAIFFCGGDVGLAKHAGT